jgi:hypothetical protein
MVRILYDGWELAYGPNGPSAVHLLTLLAAQPEGIQALVGLPAESTHALPIDVERHLIAVPDRPVSRLLWEQRRLPELARDLKADLIHSFEGGSLLGNGRSVISPATRIWRISSLNHNREGLSLAARLRDAFGYGGLSRSGGLFWPSDMADLRPAQESRFAFSRLPPVYLLPAVVHPAFSWRKEEPDLETLAGLYLPESFILYHGSGNRDALRRLLEAWSWAAGPIGEYYPLVAVGLDQSQAESFQEIAHRINVEGSVLCVPAMTLPKLGVLYRSSSALFYPQETSAWGSPLRLALACARPVVGLETQLNDKILGPAGYLVPDSPNATKRNRGLGAALISVIVEERLAERMIEVARKRSEAYKITRFSQSLGEAYRSLAGISKS